MTMDEKIARINALAHKAKAEGLTDEEKEEQAQSFESQCDFFRCYIEQKKEWEFYKVFADEGISGTSTKKREQFNRMIAEAKQRKFDLLITKGISRFARKYA